MGGRARKAGAGRSKAEGKRAHVALPERTIQRIQGALSLDLLHPQYEGREKRAPYYACVGHCYVATEALYWICGRQAGFVPFVFKHANGDTHWWLKNPATGEVLDPTKPQLKRRRFPYEQGRRAIFLTRRPSRRAAEVIRRVKQALTR